MVDEHFFENRQAMATNLSGVIAGKLSDAVAESGGAAMLLSGGQSVGECYTCLCNEDLPWHLVDISLTDERCVPRDHVQSNEGMLRETLLAKNAVAANFCGGWDPDSPAEENIRRVNSELATLKSPLDLVLLGMGLDGHVASLFPGDDILGSDEKCRYVLRRDGPDRYTVTMDTLLNTGWLGILFFGQDKLDVYSRGKLVYDRNSPVSHVLHRYSGSVNVFYSN